MSDWLLRQTYGVGAARIALCAEPHRAAGPEWSVREGVREARASAGSWRNAFGLTPALLMGLAVAIAPLLALLQQSIAPPDVDLIVLETPARSEPPPAPASPDPLPVDVAEEIPPPIVVPEEPPPAPVEVVEKAPPPPRPAVPAPPEPPRVVAVEPTPPPPTRPRPPAAPAMPAPPRIEPVALHAAPVDRAPWRSVRTEAAPTAEPVARPAVVAFASLAAPVDDPAPESAPVRSIRTSLPAESRRTPPPPVRFASALPAAPEPTSAEPPQPSLRPEHPIEPARVPVVRESKPGVAGVALASLASCRTDAQEDALKQRVLAEVRGRDRCESAAGRYVFVETRNLNAFLMYVQRAQSRREADRCVELSLALDCLRQRGGSKAGRV